MREVDAEKHEMNPMEFGNLCHYALERLGRDESMRACDHEGEVSGFLVSAGLYHLMTSLLETNAVPWPAIFRPGTETITVKA